MAICAKKFFIIIVYLAYLAAYIYVAYCLQRIANKTMTPKSWFAWIPLLNVFLVLKIASKPYWWLVLLVIPLVNIIVVISIWMDIAQKIKKPTWLGVLMILPGINAIILGYMAFSSDSMASAV